MMKRKQRKQTLDENIASLRASVSFPPDLYQMLEAIAEQKKVSVAWVVREATAEYVTNQWPLFRGKE